MSNHIHFIFKRKNLIFVSPNLFEEITGITRAINQEFSFDTEIEYIDTHPMLATCYNKLEFNSLIIEFVETKEEQYHTKLDSFYYFFKKYKLTADAGYAYYVNKKKMCEYSIIINDIKIYSYDKNILKITVSGFVYQIIN
jgi:hypothetical protein